MKTHEMKALANKLLYVATVMHKSLRKPLLPRSMNSNISCNIFSLKLCRKIWIFHGNACILGNSKIGSNLATNFSTVNSLALEIPPISLRSVHQVGLKVLYNWFALIWRPANGNNHVTAIEKMFNK